MKLMMKVKTRHWIVKPYLFFVMLRAVITRRTPDAERTAAFILKHGVTLTYSVH